MATVPTVTDNPQPVNYNLFDAEAAVLSDPLDPNRLVVLPNPLPLFFGQTAIWQIVGLTSGHHVSFFFPGFEDTQNGPFSSCVVDGSMVRGENYGFHNPTGQTLQFGTEVHYEITVIRDGSTVARGHDPLIDTLGDPPGPVEQD